MCLHDYLPLSASQIYNEPYSLLRVAEYLPMSGQVAIQWAARWLRPPSLLSVWTIPLHKRLTEACQDGQLLKLKHSFLHQVSHTK